MAWMRKTLIAVGVAAGLGYAGLAWITRDPVRPVTRIAPSGRLLLTDATIVDVADGSLRPGSSILIDGGRIVAVGAGDLAPGDRVVRRVSAGGRFVVPGYNDMHAHSLNAEDPSGDLTLMLASGITGFRQMSGSDRLLDDRRESRLPLTRDMPALLVTPGALLTPLNASRADQVRSTVREQQARGADFIKAAFVSGPVLFAALDEGRKAGIPVVGHVPAGTSVVAAAERGMRAIEHLGPANGMLIACSSQGDAILAGLRASTKIPTMPALRSHIVEKLAGWALEKRVINPAAADHEAGAIEPLKRALATFDPARCRVSMTRLRASGNWQVPTLIRLKTTYFADDPAFARDPNLRYMPPDTVSAWRDATARFAKTYPPADRAVLRQGYARSLRLVKLLDEARVPMLAGSDASGSGWEVPGFALHQEFDELARAGLTPLRILQMTTRDAATFLGRTASMGGIAPGQAADLVMLDGDPTISVANLHRIAGVVRAGYYHDRRDLDALRERVAAGKGYLK